MVTGPILAALVSPLLLYAGGAAASVPILIHLFSKRRFRRVGWAATDFLMEAQRRNRRRVRIEELILLALRCLAMFLIGLMLARMFLRPEALAAVLGSSGRTERIIVLDDSFSMGLRASQEAGLPPAAATADMNRSGAGTVFASAVAAVDQLLHWVADESPGDAVSIVLTSRPEQPVWTAPAAGTMDRQSLRGVLDGLAPSYQAGRLRESMTSVRRMLESREGLVNSVVYVVSDFQRVDWQSAGGNAEGDRPPASNLAGGKPADTASKGSPAATLAAWAGADKDRSLSLVLIDAGQDGPQNLAVTAIEPQQAQAVRGVVARYLVRITKIGSRTSAPGTLKVYLGDAAQPAVGVPEIPTGESVELPVEVTYAAEGSESLLVELPPDGLAADDVRTRADQVARALRILIINGEPSSDLYQDEAFLLSVALRPEGPQFSGNEVTILDENELEQAVLAPFHVVILANVYRVSEMVADRLEEYAAGGGGVMFFLGDQVDPELYNRILFRDGKGLLPGELRERITAPENSAVPIDAVNATHPAMRRFAEVDPALLAGLFAWEFFACTPFGTTGANAATAPAALPAPATQPGGEAPAAVLLSFGDAERHPAIVERNFGSGKVALVTSSADKEWNNFADHPVYLVLTMELVQHLARRTENGDPVNAGEPLALRLDPSRYHPQAVLRTPAYPDDPAVRLDAQPDPDTGLPVLTWRQTRLPGIYRFELTETTGAPTMLLAAVTLDPRESDLRRMDRASLLATMPDLPVEYVRAESFSGGQEVQARRELWPTILLLLVAVLMLEQALAWWFGSDRRLSSLWHWPQAARG